MRVEGQHDTPRGGLAIIAGLAIVFLSLILALVFYGRDTKPPVEKKGDIDLYVLSTRLRVRTQPSVRGAVLTTVERGTRLRLIETQGVWVKVRGDDGTTGWADRSGLERADEHARRLERARKIRSLSPLEGLVLDDDVPLYAGPGIFYPAVGELPARTRVKVYTRDHDFYAVDVGNSEIGYAEIDAIDLSSAGAARIDVAESEGEATTDTATEGAPEQTASTDTTSTQDVVAPPPVADFPAELAQPDGGGVYPVVPPGGTQPSVIHRIVPRYPAAARRAGVEGTVVVRAIIRRNGIPADVEVLRDLPEGLGEAARLAVERWRFNAATYRGEPIDVYYTVTVNFRLRD